MTVRTKTIITNLSNADGTGQAFEPAQHGPVVLDDELHPPNPRWACLAPIRTAMNLVEETNVEQLEPKDA